jgi:3-phosphoshikimate 1-carboxyvinyltransferase
MQKKINPARRIRGFVRIPGDKSISHRYGMLGSIAEGATKIHNYSTGADCHSTLRCMSALGISVEELPQNEVHIHGQGLYGLKAPVEMLDAGNSGSTIRMLSGILAAQPFVCRIAGDESLSRRPMQRIMTPLAEMGASIQARDGKYPPLEIHGGTLKTIDYTLPVPSAQVKSCVLFAGLYADGITTVRESIRTRDHSELALREFGADLRTLKGVISITGKPKLEGRELMVPGDLSSAAFFLVASLVVPQAELVLQGVGLNPTRSYLLDFLISLGAKIKVPNIQDSGGELIGDLDAKGGGISGGVIEKAQTAALIDEIPVLAVLGAVSEHGLTVRDAGELRIKETDRIAAIADNFARMGVSMEVTADGFHIPGRQKFRSAVVDSFGDHRIAMACAIAALSADGEVTIENAEAASVSYPEFYDTLAEIVEV